MLITYLDENDFVKKKRVLRTYFTRSYKYLIFNVHNGLLTGKQEDGNYKINLPTDELFELTYGKLQLVYSVIENTAILEDILPTELLTDAYRRMLPIYKGIPYRDKKDLFKLKFYERQKEVKNEN